MQRSDRRCLVFDDIGRGLVVQTPLERLPHRNGATQDRYINLSFCRIHLHLSHRFKRSASRSPSEIASVLNSRFRVSISAVTVRRRPRPWLIPAKLRHVLGMFVSWTLPFRPNDKLPPKFRGRLHRTHVVRCSGKRLLSQPFAYPSARREDSAIFIPHFGVRRTSKNQTGS